MSGTAVAKAAITDDWRNTFKVDATPVPDGPVAPKAPPAPTHPPAAVIKGADAAAAPAEQKDGPLPPPADPADEGAEPSVPLIPARDQLPAQSGKIAYLQGIVDAQREQAEREMRNQRIPQAVREERLSQGMPASAALAAGIARRDELASAGVVPGRKFYTPMSGEDVVGAHKFFAPSPGSISSEAVPYEEAKRRVAEKLREGEKRTEYLKSLIGHGQNAEAAVARPFPGGRSALGDVVTGAEQSEEELGEFGGRAAKQLREHKLYMHQLERIGQITLGMTEGEMAGREP